MFEGIAHIFHLGDHALPLVFSYQLDFFEPCDGKFGPLAQFAHFFLVLGTRINLRVLRPAPWTQVHSSLHSVRRVASSHIGLKLTFSHVKVLLARSHAPVSQDAHHFRHVGAELLYAGAQIGGSQGSMLVHHLFNELNPVMFEIRCFLFFMYRRTRAHA